MDWCVICGDDSHDIREGRSVCDFHRSMIDGGYTIAEIEADSDAETMWEAFGNIERFKEAQEAGEVVPVYVNEDAQVIYAEMRGDWNIVYYRGGSVEVMRTVASRDEAIALIDQLAQQPAARGRKGDES